MNYLNIKKLSIFPALERIAGEPLRKRDKIIISIILVLFLVVFYIVLDANKYSATVAVIEGQGKVGVNPTSERLDFGDLSPGTSMVRRVDINNSTFIPMFIAVMRFGGINDLMKLDQNFFRLAGHEQTKLEFSVYMPASAEIGKTYNGRVFLFKIPTFGL